MRKRDLRIGLHVKIVRKDKKTGKEFVEHGVTNWFNGEMVIDHFSVYGGEGYSRVDDFIANGTLKDIKLVDRVYDPHER